MLTKADRRPLVQCIDCEFLAGSERKMSWLIGERDSYFCSHPEKTGGEWNVIPLHRLWHCDNFSKASTEKVGQRERAVEHYRRVYASRKARH